MRPRNEKGGSQVCKASCNLRKAELVSTIENRQMQLDRHGWKGNQAGIFNRSSSLKRTIPMQKPTEGENAFG